MLDWRGSGPGARPVLTLVISSNVTVTADKRGVTCHHNDLCDHQNDHPPPHSHRTHETLLRQSSTGRTGH